MRSSPELLVCSAGMGIVSPMASKRGSLGGGADSSPPRGMGWVCAWASAWFCGDWTWARAERLPVAWVLASGYTPDVSRVVAVHTGTFDAALEVFAAA